MADKWTIADGINVNRKTKYNDSQNMSLDFDTEYGRAIDTARNDADTINVDASNFSGTMSDEAQLQITDVEALNVSPLNRASVDDIRFEGTPQNPVQSILSDDEMNALEEQTKSWNEYNKQNTTAQTTFLWTNN